jgi:hypothetical protein
MRSACCLLASRWPASERGLARIPRRSSAMVPDARRVDMVVPAASPASAESGVLVCKREERSMLEARWFRFCHARQGNNPGAGPRTPHQSAS